MRFCYENAFTDSILTVTNEDSNYPIENIYDTRLSKIYRSLTTEIRILFDAGLGYTLTPDSVTINAHNISDTATIRIEGNDSDSWGSPSFSQEITYNELCMLEFFTASAYRYWSIYIDDPTNADGYIQIGHSFLGNYLSIDMPIGNDFSFFIRENSKKSTSPTGQVYGHNSGVWLKGYNLKLDWITNAEKDSLLAMYDYIRNFKPFYFIIDENYTDDMPVLYCTIDNELEFTHIAGFNWSVEFSLLEAR